MPKRIENRRRHLQNALEIMAHSTNSHVCAALVTGEVYCWGDNNSGEMGIGFVSQSEPTPTQVVGVVDASNVATGYFHSCALRLNAKHLICWGSNNFGQLGSPGSANQLTPIEVYPSPTGAL